MSKHQILKVALVALVAYAAANALSKRSIPVASPVAKAVVGK